MTHIERVEFLQEHIKRVQSVILSNTFRMPESWDGLELKQYIADTFMPEKHWWDKKRKKQYDKDVMENYL